LVSKTAVLLANTATVSGVIGIARDGRVLAEVPLELSTSSNRVVAAVDEALAEAGCQREEIFQIVLVKGPGTFTGSRVGASIVKGMSYALPCALASVTTLAAVAWTGLQRDASRDVSRHVWALLDARRHQFYAQEFIRRDDTLDVEGEPACLGPEVFDAVRRSGGLAACAFPLSVIPESQRPGPSESVVWEFSVYPTSRGIVAASARASMEDPFTLEPAYLRTTEELFDRPKETS
jgi:tRNA threonylcarbamoyl adenosine modification protein YeaZ